MLHSQARAQGGGPTHPTRGAFMVMSSPGLPAATLCHHKLGIFEKECAARSSILQEAVSQASFGSKSASSMIQQ